MLTIVSSQMQLFGRTVTYYAVIAIAGTLLAMGLSALYGRQMDWPVRPYAYAAGIAFAAATILRLYQEYLPGAMLPFMVLMSVIFLSAAAYAAGRLIRQRLHVVFAFASPVYLGVCKLGCFLSGCCTGVPYSGPLAVWYGKGTLSSVTEVPLFPAQLVTAALLFAAAAAAYAMMLRRQDMPAYLAAAGFTPLAYYAGALFCGQAGGMIIAGRNCAPVLSGLSLTWVIYWLVVPSGGLKRN